MSNQKMRAADYEYIEAHRHEMSERELAEALRVSKTTVHRAIKRLGLQAPQGAGAAVPAAPQEPPEESVDRLVRLRRIAATLDRSMSEASPGALPAITKEYRAALEEIASIEAADEPAPAKAARGKREAKVTAFDVIRGSRAPLGKAAEV